MKTLKELNFITLLSIFTVLSSVALFQFGYLYLPQKSQVTDAQSTIAAFLIGGETEGVSDLCCNGVVLDFDSVNPLNPYILNGEAIMVPFFSQSYDNGNEYSSGYNTVGKVFPGICITVESECYSAESKPWIVSIGTAGSQ